VISYREHWIRLLDGPFPRQVRCVPLRPHSRILITQLDKIGDVLCSTAAIGLLREVLPEAHITVAVQPYSRDVLIRHPDINEVLSLSVPWSSARFAGGMHERIRTVLAVGRLLRQGRFDIGLDLQGNPLNALLMWLAGIPLRVGMSSLGGNVWLTAGQRMDWFANRAAFRLRLIERLTGRTGRPVTRFDPAPEDVAWVGQLWANLGVDRPVVVLCPTAENPLRMWDETRYMALGRRLSTTASVFFGHSANDAATAERFREAWAGVEHCHVVPTGSLGRLGAMLSAASVVVSNDSAPLHLAVAVGTPVVAVFGPSPPSAAGPYDWEYNRVLEPSVICKPCLWGPRAGGCGSRRCLDSIGVERVERAVRELLAREAGT